ncbi:MAG: fasciclin domain-containing protein, partial [Flavobacteriales bacterium]
VVLPNETVVDVALDNGFSSLATAVITAELLPVLTDPFAEFTVFAPDNAAFDAAAAALGTDIPGLLALPNLGDILTYHVLAGEVTSDMINNGDVVDAVSMTNTLKLTVTSDSDVFVNQAQVMMPNVEADNGVVHVLNAVVLPNETVVDVALDNGFSTLATAVITAELLPALTDPFSEFTVFAPTNTAFDELALELETDIAGLLALPTLSDILLYHVVSGTVLSSGLMNGDVPTLQGQNVTVDLTDGTFINDSEVTGPDNTADNGVVHIIDMVLVPSITSVDEAAVSVLTAYPNPAVDVLRIDAETNSFYKVFDMKGSIVLEGALTTNGIAVSSLPQGMYVVQVLSGTTMQTAQFMKM